MKAGFPDPPGSCALLGHHAIACSKTRFVLIQLIVLHILNDEMEKFMAACTKCGSVIQGGAAFCAACGSPVSDINSSITPPPPPFGAASAGMTSNVAGALCYLVGFITGIIFLVLEPYKRDKFVRFHAFQSIFISVVMCVFNIVWSNLFLRALSFGFLWTIFSLISGLVHLGFFLLWLFLMYKAYKNETYMLPVIGEMASNQAAK